MSLNVNKHKFWDESCLQMIHHLYTTYSVNEVAKETSVCRPLYANLDVTCPTLLNQYCYIVAYFLPQERKASSKTQQKCLPKM